MRRAVPLLLWMAVVAVGADRTGNAQSLFQVMNGARIVAPDGAAGRWFGESVAIDGDTMVIGAPDNWLAPVPSGGAAYVFVRAGLTWALQQKLTVPGLQPWAHFGEGVAIEGDIVAVGALQGRDGPGGEAYVFVRTNGHWNQQAAVKPSDSSSNDQFGWRIALSERRLLVGAIGQDAAYVFERVGKAWSQKAKLVPPVGWPLGDFGWTLSLSGDTAVIGPVGRYADDGEYQRAACTYVRSTTWKLEQVIEQPEPGSTDRFAESAAISGDTVILGAYGENTDAGDGAGAIYIYVRSNGRWRLAQRLEAPDGAAGDLFGFSVAVDGDTAAAGALKADTDGGEDAGAVYVLEREGGAWRVASRREVAGETSRSFGYGLAVSAPTVVMGDPAQETTAGVEAGAVYVTGFGHALRPVGSPIIGQ